MELRDYIRVLRRNWLFIVVMTLVGLLAAGTFSMLQTPEFQSTAKVFVSTSGGGSVAELQQGSAFAQQRVRTYADLVSTSMVIDPVIDEIGLELTAEQLASSISTSVPANTSIIEISVRDSDPALSAQIATALSESLTVTVDRIETTSTAADEAQSPVRLTLVQPAAVPQRAVSPNIPLNLSLGGLLGLAAGIAFAVLREVLDTRIRNEHDVQSVTDHTIIGGIVFDPKAKERPLIVQADPRSPRSESFRSLRTNLQFLDADQAHRTFVVTSSVESEGKSTTTANLAITLAETGLRVLLVDADLRRPKMSLYMGIEGAVGLTDVLIGRVTLQDAVQRWGDQQLFLLPAGTIPPNPSELLGSRSMVEVVKNLHETFDVVLYDAPPLLPVTDAAILTRSVGSALVIAAAGRVHKSQLAGALSTLENVGGRVAGIIMTMLPTKGPDAYGQQRYGYGYGYGYGAGAESKTAQRTK
jgi:capsular exopolysaccharide synthesis family protein